ncbi:DUF2007 domain-containing protein, partial [Stenotrophomonas geniculata]
MHIVYKADNLFDAHLVKHALEDAGIPAFVFGESLLGGMGELPLFGVPVSYTHIRAHQTET